MNNNQTMGDKEVLNDSLASQKYITSSYNTYANECTNQQLKKEFMNILNDEHNIQYEVFNELTSRGWYSPETADQNKVTQAKQKFSSMQ